MQSVYFAAKYPEYVAAMYLDAPVINLLSCPAGLGKGHAQMFGEFKDAMGIDLTELLSYRNHPLDNFEPLVKNNIPVMLVAGDSDDVVPYDENGALLEKYYNENGGKIKVIVKSGCNHHPHGLADNTPIIDFVLKYYK